MPLQVVIASQPVREQKKCAVVLVAAAVPSIELERISVPLHHSPLVGKYRPPRLPFSEPAASFEGLEVRPPRVFNPPRYGIHRNALEGANGAVAIQSRPSGPATIPVSLSRGSPSRPESSISFPVAVRSERPRSVTRHLRAAKSVTSRGIGFSSFARTAAGTSELSNGSFVQKICA